MSRRLRAGVRRQGGFTLIEVLVALVILMVGFLAMTTMHVTSARANTMARRRTMATLLAHQQIERFQRLDANSIDAGTDTATMDGYDFARSWTKTDNAGTSDTVQVTVSWSDQWGSNSVSIPSVIRP
jgi:type IV pilus assembly protein PilV